MDLYIVNGATLEAARNGRIQTRSALYRNNKDGTFTDVTIEARVPNQQPRLPLPPGKAAASMIGLNGDIAFSGERWGKGALTADLNGDGLQDLYVLNFGPNVLYLNNGDGTFRDATATAGVGDPRWSSAAAAADYDKDGDLDLFVANYLDYDLKRLPTEGKFCLYQGISVACGPRGLKGASDVLYRNNGDGTFTDVSRQAGVSDSAGYYGLGAAWGDYDNDGDPDLFVANDSTPNYLYRNNGEGTFTDVAIEAGVAFNDAGQEQACMGVEFEDLDNDGLLDLMVTNFSDDYNTFYRNIGKGYFRDDSHAVGIVGDSWRDLSWGVGFFDFNNDGWKDVFVANGHIYPQVDRHPLGVTYRQANKLYLNAGVRKWINASADAGPGLALRKSSRGAAFADFNNDGWMDVAVVEMDEPPSLLINQGIAGQHWLIVSLKGQAIGARVTVTTEGRTQMREVKAGGSYASSNDLRAHFGIGAARVVDELVVMWPSGRRMTASGLAADGIITIAEAGGKLEVTRGSR
jgi:hypothetical protein